MKKIVFINQDSGYLMIDIINAHVAKGYECVLLTGRLVERNTKLSGRVKVVRIAKYNRSSTFHRIQTWFVGFLQILFQVLFRFRHHELFIVSNPPIATLLPLFVKRNFRLLIFDVYPDALSELGFISKGGFLDRLWQKANRKVYKGASRVYCLTEGMKSLLAKYTRPENIEVVPVWSDNTYFKPIDKTTNPFISEFKLEDKFIVMYSGNIGRTHNVELIVQLASAVSDPAFLFVIIGEGEAKNGMIKKTSELGLKNILYLPWQSPDTIPFSFGAADIAIISQSADASSISIPSKTYNFLSSGVPILAISKNNSELQELTDKYECGKSFTSDQIAQMVDYIIELKNNYQLKSKLSDNALKASLNFTPLNAQTFVDNLPLD